MSKEVKWTKEDDEALARFVQLVPEADTVKITDDLIVRFYLGRLTELEDVAVTLYSTKEESVSRMDKIEGRLIDKFILEKLQDDQMRWFKENYLVTPLRQKRVMLIAMIFYGFDQSKAYEISR